MHTNNRNQNYPMLICTGRNARNTISAIWNGNLFRNFSLFYFFFISPPINLMALLSILFPHFRWIRFTHTINISILEWVTSPAGSFGWHVIHLDDILMIYIVFRKKLRTLFSMVDDLFIVYQDLLTFIALKWSKIMLIVLFVIITLRVL